MDIKSLSKNLYQQSSDGFTDRLQFAVNGILDGDRVLRVGVGWGESGMGEWWSAAHVRYNLWYHFVWSLRYRHRLLKENVLCVG